jgi:predicted lipoprotein
LVLALCAGLLLAGCSEPELPSNVEAVGTAEEGLPDTVRVEANYDDVGTPEIPFETETWLEDHAYVRAKNLDEFGGIDSSSYRMDLYHYYVRME